MSDREDQKLKAAFLDVPVPEGLAERLLQCLEVANSPNFHFNERGAVPLGRFSRRWLISGVGLLTAAAGLLLAVWLGLQSTDKLTEQLVLDEAIRYFCRSMPEETDLHPLSEQDAPREYPLSPCVVQLRGTAWTPLNQFLGQEGVVYHMPGRAGTRAALYVLDAAAVSTLPGSPAWRPFTTAGCCASAWQEGNRLYVLVVQGDVTTYRSYLNRPHSPVA